jgi:hypothetical protein
MVKEVELWMGNLHTCRGSHSVFERAGDGGILHIR